MPSQKRSSRNWRRVGTHTQEAEGHRVHAQMDLVDNAWKFVAVRKGDGIHQCKTLAQFDTAKEARAHCEADDHDFHWEPMDISSVQGFRLSRNAK